MPWDTTTLWLAPVTPTGEVGQATVVAGGKDESILQPEWSPDGVLHFVSDRNGWWNLYRWTGKKVGIGLPRGRRVRCSALDLRERAFRLPRRRPHRRHPDHAYG